MTEAELKEFLNDNAEEIRATVKKRVIERLLAEHNWDITQTISKAVKEFVDAEIVPAVRDHLADQKGAIVAAAVGALATISDDLAKNLAADAAKNAADEWRRKNIVKAIFSL